MFIILLVLFPQVRGRSQNKKWTLGKIDVHGWTAGMGGNALKAMSLFIGRLGVRARVPVVRGDLEGKGRRAAS